MLVMIDFNKYIYIYKRLYILGNHSIIISMLVGNDRARTMILFYLEYIYINRHNTNRQLRA